MSERLKTKKFVFTVEGETEKWYLLWLRDQINKCEHRQYNVSIDRNTEEQYKVELWRYDSGRIADSACVDRLSLTLALGEDRDERVEETAGSANLIRRKIFCGHETVLSDA